MEHGGPTTRNENQKVNTDAVFVYFLHHAGENHKRRKR